MGDPGRTVRTVRADEQGTVRPAKATEFRIPGPGFVLMEGTTSQHEPVSGTLVVNTGVPPTGLGPRPPPERRTTAQPSVHVASAWVNGKGYIIKHRVEITRHPDGTETQTAQPLSPEDQAKIPPVDPALYRPPTPAEDAAFKAAIEAEQARYYPPGLRGPGTPPRPGGDPWADFTPPPIGEVVTVWEPPPGLR